MYNFLLRHLKPATVKTVYEVINRAFLIYVYVGFFVLAILGYISNGWIGTIFGDLGMIYVVIALVIGVKFIGPEADL